MYYRVCTSVGYQQKLDELTQTKYLECPKILRMCPEVLQMMNKSHSEATLNVTVLKIKVQNSLKLEVHN